MKWRKLGRIFDPDENLSWFQTHAAVPTVLPLKGHRCRVYFSGRDRQGRSNTGFFEIDLREPHRILRVSDAAVLSPGPPGAFDDSGAMGTWLLDRGEEKWLYYIGWNLGVTVPFRNALGLAISRDGGETFKKFSEGPILDRSAIDPYFTASAAVFQADDHWKMWYLSCTGWTPFGDSMRHHYLIKYATSADGVHWVPTGTVGIDFQSEAEYAISRPSVVYEDGIYKMWYSYRGEKYRIGYAESEDGIAWTRMDRDVGIDVSPSGWDSEMIEYPCVFDHEGSRYLLYNGNGYGSTGIGLAVLSES